MPCETVLDYSRAARHPQLGPLGHPAPRHGERSGGRCGTDAPGREISSALPQCSPRSIHPRFRSRYSGCGRSMGNLNSTPPPACDVLL